MAFSVQMPALGESVTEGTVTRWLKQEGDTVELDEPLLEVSTDKVDTEIPSPAAGVLTKITAREDDTVEVGGELAVIGDAAEGAKEPTAAGTPQPQPAAEPTPQPQPEPQAERAPQPQPEPQAERAPEPQPAAEPAPQPQPSVEPTPAATPAGEQGATGTSQPVLMPELGESVTEGTVTRWLKKVGDSVEVDEPLVEVSTDKVDTEIPSPVAGTLASITAEEDVTVPVGGELAKISVGAETPAAPAAEPQAPPARQPEAPPPPRPEPAAEPARPAPTPQPEAKPEPASAPQPPPDREPAPTATVTSTPYVTPLVRKLASENDVDLTGVTGTGVGGRIRKQDVLAAAEAKKAPAPQAPTPEPALAHLRGTTQTASRIRQITAKKTRESLQATAQLTQTHEVDMTRIVALRARAKAGFAEREGVNLTFLPFIARAVIDALKTHPNINASYNEDTKEITYYDAEHLGFAVDTDQGLLSPVIHNAG
ncbi:MAG: 2-oxoglutarate dehydrogenase, E2 component, dihydrolipoamide succinyltransferase, partial [Mycobacterium sp.]